MALPGPKPRSLNRLIYVQYVIKLGIAVVDTPLVYGLVGLVRRIEGKETVQA